MNKVYLVENRAQVENLMTRFGEDHDAMWIALTPFAMAALDDRKIQYSIPEDFYTNEELWQVGLESFEIVNELCKRLDNFAFSKSPELKRRNLTLYRNYNYPLYLLFDAVLSRIFELRAISQKANPEEIICYKTEKYPFFWRGIGFDKRESVYSRILEECNWQENIHFLSAVEPEKNKNAERDYRGIFSRVINNFKTKVKKKIPVLWQIKRFGLSNFLKTAPILLRNNINLAIIGADYEWGECEFSFNLNGIRIKRFDINFDESGLPVEDDNLKQEILREVKNLLIFKGINFANLLISRLSFIYQIGQKRCIKAYDKAVRSINKVKPVALLFSTLCAPELRSAAIAFKQNRISSFCKSHGSVGAFETRKLLDNELLYADYYLTNGDIVTKLYKKFISEYYSNNLKTFSVVSPHLEGLKHHKGKITAQLRKWLKERKGHNNIKNKIGLYVIATYLQNLSHIVSFPPLSDRLLFKTQKTIINFFKNKQDASLIWKLHPYRNCDRPPYLEKGSGNIFFVREEIPFTDLLAFADFVIIDFPATTCLQAMTTKLPLFIVTKHVSYFPEAEEMLERRAVCCQEPEDLIKKIENFLLFDKYEADTEDDTFIMAYGLGDGKFNAAERIVSSVINSLNPSQLNHDRKSTVLR